MPTENDLIYIADKLGVSGLELIKIVEKLKKENLLDYTF